MDTREQAELEIDLSRAWTRLPRSRTLATVDGRKVDVIHLGVWTHGFGPDFRDAIVSIDNGPAVTGSVEIHLRTRGWTDHKHHLDPRYNDVVLHVVGQHDALETRRADGKLVPTVVLGIEMSGATQTAVDWSLVGGDVCAEPIARSNPDLLREALGALGDTRMTARTAVLEADLQWLAPDEVLYREILGALGYRQNRDQMHALAEALPWTVLARVPDCESILAALLGTAGFLPMSDVEIAAAGLAPVTGHGLAERWSELARNWSLASLPSGTWELARLRPQNHPLRRLVQFAALIGATGGWLANEALAVIRAELDPAQALLELVNRDNVPPLGRDRAQTVATNVLIPFAFAIAGMTGDQALVDSAAAVWAGMKAGEANERTRTGIRQVAGEVGLKRLTERHMQGLVHLVTTLCEPRRCYECPVARIVVSNPG